MLSNEVPTLSLYNGPVSQAAWRENLKDIVGTVHLKKSWLVNKLEVCEVGHPPLTATSHISQR